MNYDNKTTGIKVSFKATVDNSDYRYGDLNRDPTITVTGTGFVQAILMNKYHNPIAIVCDDRTGKFYSVLIYNLKAVLSD